MPFQKGHSKIGGRQIGSKNRETLLKEERRAIFDYEISQVYEAKIHAARPEYVLDQFLGKAVEEIKHSGEMTIHNEDITSEVLAEIKARNRKKLLNAK